MQRGLFVLKKFESFTIVPLLLVERKSTKLFL